MGQEDVLTSIRRGHDSVTAVMTSRGKNLHIVRALRYQGLYHGAGIIGRAHGSVQRGRDYRHTG